MPSPLSSPRISVETASRVATLSLCNPPLNVIDIAMMEELARSLQEIDAAPNISIILLRGAGKVFSAGVDVPAHTPDKVSEMLTKFHAVIGAIVASKKVTIAAVHGHCLGGGAELAMVCDMAFTSDDAQWGFPEIKLGCYPPVACTALAALVGQKCAAELILTGRTMSGREAVEMGLATRALPEDRVSSSVAESIDQLLLLSPASLAIAKKASYAWDAMHFDKGLMRAEKIYLDELMKTEDAQEGIRAFMEKRSPAWKGR